MYGQRVSVPSVILHTALVGITGGAWLVVLVVRYLLANS